MPKHVQTDHQSLQCMEIWGGIEPVRRTVTTPGLDLWVFSEPFGGDEQGGDVHYVTLCGGGIITRIVVADVSGHGSSVAEFSSSLRLLLRKNINQKSQKRLVGRLNRQFGEMAEMQRFATALVVTYLASTDRLSVCNAGHPRPLYWSARASRWTLIAADQTDQEGGGNLPLGLDEGTRYHNTELTLGPGDVAIFYTDALTEAADRSGKLIGEQGLLALAAGLDVRSLGPAEFGSALLLAVGQYRESKPAEDDVTMIVLHHNGSGSPRLSIAQKVDVYVKFFGLKPV